MQENQLVISNITDLQIALMRDDNSAIKSYLERVDRETANEAMRRMGERFGFPTVEINGIVMTSLTHLARIFGYKTPFGLQKLLENRGIYGIGIGGFLQKVEINIIDALGLDPQDRKTLLYDYPAFLIGAMNSTNLEAKEVQLYLMECERIARIGAVALKSVFSTQDTFPNPVHALVKAKLCIAAWKGNALAQYVLETDYRMPVQQLMHRTDPEFSVLAGLITQYLHLIHEENIVRYGLEIADTKAGFYIQGESLILYQTFLDVSRRHNLRIFYDNQNTLGTILSREQDALEMLGFKRTIAKTSHGHRHYRYEYSGGKTLALAKNN